MPIRAAFILFYLHSTNLVAQRGHIVCRATAVLVVEPWAFYSRPPACPLWVPLAPAAPSGRGFVSLSALRRRPPAAVTLIGFGSSWLVDASEQKSPICFEVQVTSILCAMIYVGSREDRPFLLGSTALWPTPDRQTGSPPRRRAFCLFCPNRSDAPRPGQEGQEGRAAGRWANDGMRPAMCASVSVCDVSWERRKQRGGARRGVAGRGTRCNEPHA